MNDASDDLNASRLIEIREWLGLSQEQFARLLCMSYATINRWERKRSEPSGFPRELCRALDKIQRSGYPASSVVGGAPMTPGLFFARILWLAYGAKGVPDGSPPRTNKRRKKK